MKVAVVGYGNVGKAIFRELQILREIDELVLVGRRTEFCQAEALDYIDALPMRIDKIRKVSGGNYELAKDADILVYCAGPSVQVEDRLSIARENLNIMKEVFTEVDKYAPDALVVCVTNPLDVITTAVQKFTGRPASKVIGTGTFLDTARLKTIIAWSLDISIDNISGCVVGEHGATSVVLDSSIHILGMPIQKYLDLNHDGVVPDIETNLEVNVRDAGFKIFRGKGYTSTGVAAAATRIVYDIINDTHKMYPVSSVLNGQYDIDGFAISVPCMIGREGIMSVQNIDMTPEEKEKFRTSAETIKNACISAGVLDK